MTSLAPTCDHSVCPLKTTLDQDLGIVFDHYQNSHILGDGVRSVLNALFCAALFGAVHMSPAWAEGGILTVELNKFEVTETADCRTFFLFRNDTGKSFEAFELSLAILNTSGVIDRLLTIDASPIPVARTTLKLFEIPEMRCADISEVLLHEIEACKPQNEEPLDCFPLLDLVSRTSATLVK